MDKSNFVIGIDFGTDSVRALIVDSSNGKEISSDVRYYPRWEKGKYCIPQANQFRQHPQDYLDSMELAILNALAKSPEGTDQNVKAISVDTTGSTICAVDTEGTPLALREDFEDNPNAMFIIWKDHTAVKEAGEINEHAKNWGGEDYTKYSGGVYSSEWFWSKILHTLRVDENVRAEAYSWIEHCDWIPAVLTGNTDPKKLKRSRTAAGHKALWHESWGGLPPEEFLAGLDPLLAGLRKRLYKNTYTCDAVMGKLSYLWAKRLGLSTKVKIGVGSFDAHTGGIGAGIAERMLVKVMGTSTCDMIASGKTETDEKLVQGICGQVDGSIIPGMLGLEAGQSAVGDVYAWFRDLLIWPVELVLKKRPDMKYMFTNEIRTKLYDDLIYDLSFAAEKIALNEDDEVAIDWMNGRRTPYANQALKGVISGINLGSDTPRIFKSLVEATAFGARKIVERFREEGVEIDEIIAVGGIPKKSSYVMQVHADVLNMPINVAASDQACALGAAMAAAAVAGIYPSVNEAQKAMGTGFEKTYHPNPEKVKIYNVLYDKYSALGNFIENEFTSK